MIRTTLAAAAMVLGVVSSPALGKQEGSMTNDDPDAVDVAKTPVTDLNIDKQEIPALLIKAQRQPYDLGGLGSCAPIINAVEELDRLLGPDIDLPQAERDRISAGRVGKTVVGSFIPFRGLIREVSGANEHQKKVNAAIQAGLARRGFLKGVGQSRGCRYPGRPASRKDITQWMARNAAERQAREEKKQKSKAK